MSYKTENLEDEGEVGEEESEEDIVRNDEMFKTLQLKTVFETSQEQSPSK